MSGHDDPTLPGTLIGPAVTRPRRRHVPPRPVAWLALVLLGAAAGVGFRLVHDHGTSPVGEGDAIHGDVDGDGRADLLLSDAAEIRVFRSVGGRFVRTGLRTDSAEEAARGDVDGDGRSDLVTVVPGDDTLDLVLRRAARSGFGPPTRKHVDGIGRGDRIVLADVDGDGRDDLIGVGRHVTVALSTGSGFGTPRRWGDVGSLGPQAFVLAGMFTDDGRADLLVIDRSDDGVVLRVLPSAGHRFGAPELWRDIPGWRIDAMRPVVGDFDGDRRTDVAELGRPSAGGSDVMVLRSRGVDFGPQQQWLRDPGLDWSTTRLVAGDYNGDGRADLAAFERQSDGSTAVVVLPSTGSGFATPSTWLTTTATGDARPVGVGTGVLGVR